MGNMEVKVAHGVVMISVFVDEQRATFGTLKQEICRMSEVPVQYQRILWRGREREDHEKLKNVGIRKNSKVILDDSAFRQYKNAQKLKNEPKAENVPVEMKIIEKIKSKIDEVESK